MLREEVKAQGMGEWIAPDGETAMQQMVDQLERGEDTPVNYDPLMSCHHMLMSRAMETAGLAVMAEDFGCPICRFNERRNPDGSCPCHDPACPGKEPGSVPDFEGWIVGEDSCVAAAKDYMVTQGWMSR